jgi:hypothetical protein
VLVALILVTPISLAVYEIAQQSDILIGWMKRAGEGGIRRRRRPGCRRSMRTTYPISSGHSAVSCFTAYFYCFSPCWPLFALLRNGRAVASRFLETSDRLFGEAGEGLVER